MDGFENITLAAMPDTFVVQALDAFDELRFWQNAWGLGPIGATCGVLVVVAKLQRAMCL